MARYRVAPGAKLTLNGVEIGTLVSGSYGPAEEAEDAPLVAADALGTCPSCGEGDGRWQVIVKATIGARGGVVGDAVTDSWAAPCPDCLSRGPVEA